MKFINTLVKNGIAVHRATVEFSLAGETYPAGSYVVKTNQAFRPPAPGDAGRQDSKIRRLLRPHR